LTFDAKNQKTLFRENIENMIREFLCHCQKPMVERMKELLCLFGDEVIQIEKKKLRLVHFREIKPLEFSQRNLKEGLIGRSRDSLWIGAMGTRAKQRAAEGQIALDFTYGVIDKCLLRALSGESSLILTAGGMVRRVEVRVSAFAEEWGTRIPVDEVRSP
jgi:hypothetical protein